MEETPNDNIEMENGEQEEWDDDEDYDDEDDADIDAEALEIARRLGEQLWAVASEGNTTTTEAPAVSVDPGQNHAAAATGSGPMVAHSVVHPPRKEEAIIGTMRAILNLVEKDPLAKSTLVSTHLPNGPNIFEILLQCTTMGTIATGLSGPLSQVIVTLARSDTLFGNLKQSNASAIQLDKGKRKRDEFDDGHYQPTYAFKRPYVPDLDLQNQVVDAVRVISQALGTSAPSQALDPSLVSSIRLQLHQVFLFAVTSAVVAGPSMLALQEIGGLIQVIGVLSGIQIGYSPENINQPPGQQQFGQNPPYSWNQNQPPMATDIGTAVYPCLVVGCHKTFSRLYSLRAHQRSHSTHRPFRCNACPASFARNHDLKRHLKLHDKKAWKCEGCHKIFSRRDAIKRHKNGTKNRGPKSEICLVAEVIEVQLDGEEGEDALREERRAKLWNGIVVNEASVGANANPQNMYRDLKTVDEGEINPVVIAGMQASVIGLHGLLQVLVGNALGNPVGHPSSVPVDPPGGQATLASVIARAQSQSLPPSTFMPSPLSAQGPFDQSSNHTDSNVPTADEGLLQPQAAGESLESHQTLPSLSMYGLSDEQAQQLELAIASAASAAQAQAEAEAALEEEEEDDYDDENEYDDSEMEQDKEPAPAPQ